MSVTSAKTGSTSLSLALENNFMEPIATTVVGSSGTNIIEFKDIPQTYKHLQVRIHGRTTRVATDDLIFTTFNGDNGNNYSWHSLYGDGASAVASYYVASASSMRFQRFPSASASANIFGDIIFDILDYTNINKNKTVRSLGGYDANGSGMISFGSGVWYDINTISTISMVCSLNFIQYTRASLYGIKG